MRAAAETSGRFSAVSGFSRPAFDITDEASIAHAAERIAAVPAPLRFVFVATGLLHDGAAMPEKGLKQLDPAFMAKNFAVNAIGPALVMKHVIPLMAREGRAVFAVISAKVASLGDNALGGWHSYRASKAALNMYARNAAIEAARTRPDLIIASLHPGTVETRLSAPFAKAGLDVRPPAVAAADMARVIDTLTPAQSGGFFNHKGEALPW
ncbi:MAG: SDR family NAD(P)-dependent oxidoreductase [Rhizobiaceae bacterium]|nr:SDR family NAD(P)-dependent oxidoreductase [Rhizobiaceae bacterium]